MDPDAQDEVFGRRIMDNSKIDDGPAAAHAKRTEQESFSPEAIILRRPMMRSNGEGEGMMFTSYSFSLRQFYWCLPVHDN